jgi:hypothetical protein
VVKVLSDFAGTLRPPRYARDGPSRLTDLAAITLPSSSRSAPEESSTSSMRVVTLEPSSVVVKRPSTTARADPERTRLASARAPPSRCRPVTTMVLPVPVSPVSTVRPRPNSAVAALMAPSASILISASTTGHANP